MTQSIDEREQDTMTTKTEAIELTYQGDTRPGFSLILHPYTTDGHRTPTQDKIRDILKGFPLSEDEEEEGDYDLDSLIEKLDPRFMELMELAFYLGKPDLSPRTILDLLNSLSDKIGLRILDLNPTDGWMKYDIKESIELPYLLSDWKYSISIPMNI
jgi:hypothetical protein